ncbi:uncharacterized protein E0L32_008333 [Thyridium curvatum]|uniref:Glycosylphosphatidylinositol anchor biosynthesis protein 11 n=1 Tax=Thyridium curvatum TaxID=1093900 RepID=A0A507AWH3_9PEZI|nr:uncharacterized protein E0L32_008333 [Thyridium curvatum]TPX10764.1 hypothetical protein E0L32_008333 [Thyridium curvatum]
MSSSSPAGKASGAHSPAVKPLQPVAGDASALSQGMRYAVPPILLAVFASTFSRLVADPVPTMALNLAVAGGWQVAYCLLCLPVAGASSGAASRKPRPGEKKRASDSAGPNMAVAVVLSLVLTLFAVPAVHAAMVLLGAPFLTHTAHTLLCAAHLAALAFFPLFWTRGVDSAAWLAIAGLRAPLDECVGGLVGAAAGAWLGAVPIPLDWDREWQKWPVTILSGMYAGYVLGRVLGGTVLFGKRF